MEESGSKCKKIKLSNDGADKHEDKDQNNSISSHSFESKTYKGYGLDLDFSSIKQRQLSFKKIVKDNLDIDYVKLFSKYEADTLLNIFENELEYIPEEKSSIKIFGKVHKIPRKQAVFGEPGLAYKFSGITLSSDRWPTPLLAIRDLLLKVTGFYFNFVLVNRYKDGGDKIGEHKDDEKDLDSKVPIASLSFGQARKFYFKHQDARGKLKKKIDKVEMLLEHGTLLLMNPPTNRYWYHALPPTKTANDVRVNLTFRKLM